MLCYMHVQQYLSNCLLLMVGNNSPHTHNYQTVESLKINIKTLGSVSYVLRFWNVEEWCLCNVCTKSEVCVMISLSYNKMSNQKVMAFCDLNQCQLCGFLWFLLATLQEVTYIFHKFIDITNYFKSKYLVLMSWYYFLFIWNISPKRIIIEK
jgi:cobalamin synthase